MHVKRMTEVHGLPRNCSLIHEVMLEIYASSRGSGRPFSRTALIRNMFMKSQVGSSCILAETLIASSVLTRAIAMAVSEAEKASKASVMVHDFRMITAQESNVRYMVGGGLGIATFLLHRQGWIGSVGLSLLSAGSLATLRTAYESQ